MSSARQTPPSPTPTRRERAALRKADIVDIAARRFAERGFRGTSIADVAAEAGITQPGLLHHFGSKEGLLRAVVERRDAQSEAFARELLEMAPAQRLGVMPQFALRNKDRPGLAKLFAVLVAESFEVSSPLHDHFADRYRNLRAIVAESISSAQQTGLARADIDPQRKAAEILATLDGLQTQWLLAPDEVDIVESVEYYSATLQRDLAVPR